MEWKKRFFSGDDDDDDDDDDEEEEEEEEVSLTETFSSRMGKIYISSKTYVAGPDSPTLAAAA